MIWRVLIATPWVIFCVYWLLGARNTRRTVSTEPFWSRYGVLALEIGGFVLIFTDLGGIGTEPMYRQTVSVAGLGVICVWMGIGIAVWARASLGRNWSARVTLKEGHELIRTGPYAYFRHPIYSGLDLAALGGALAIDEWRCLAGVCCVVAGYWMKAAREESMLTEQFGAAFVEHRGRTGFLFPKFSDDNE